MTTPRPPAKPYFFFMDAVRGALMVSVVPYHAARIYASGRPDSSQVLVADTVSFGFEIFAEILHSFRNQAFFVVAGFFAAMLLARGSSSTFLRNRLTRLGVPLLTCTILFAPINAATVIASQSADGSVSAAEVIDWLGRYSSAWVRHLWFLHTLLMMTVIVATAASLLRARPELARPVLAASRWLSALARRPFYIGGTLLVLLATTSWIAPSVLYRVTGIHLAPFGNFFNPRDVFHQFPFFVFGVALWHQRDVFAWIKQPAKSDLPLALVGSTIGIIGAQDFAFSGTVSALGSCMAGLFWAKFLIAAAARWLDRPTRVFQYLADASFTVYLFHFAIAMALGLLFLQVDWPIIIEYLIIVGVTFIACFAIHALIERSPLLAYLFNGKPMSARTAKAPQASPTV